MSNEHSFALIFALILSIIMGALVGITAYDLGVGIVTTISAFIATFAGGMVICGTATIFLE